MSKFFNGEENRSKIPAQADTMGRNCTPTGDAMEEMLKSLVARELKSWEGTHPIRFVALGLPIALIGLMLFRHYEGWRSDIGLALLGSGLGLALFAVVPVLLAAFRPKD